MRENPQNKIYTQSLPSGPSFDMIWVEGGAFQMGGTDENASDREIPIHQVNVPSFYIGKYPVTQDLWEAIMGNNPSGYEGPQHPVDSVSWDDAKEFIQQLNKQSSQSYRLPTEAEWEFAARGGIHTEEYLYSGSDKLSEVGWYRENAGNGTQAVGQLLENELGLFDMSGNVREWCEDDFHDNYEGAPKDGSAWIDGPERAESRVLRGGSWLADARSCRVSARARGRPGGRDHFFGFRLVLPRVQGMESPFP